MPPQENAAFAQAQGNAVLLLRVQSGKAIYYYAGAGWSQTDMPTPQAWNVYLAQFVGGLKHSVK